MKRTETDSFGPIEVENKFYWGAQTQRSLKYFAIGQEKMPTRVIHALVLIKKVAAKVNYQLGLLSKEFADKIIQACDRVLAGEFVDHFPLSVWQTGSGTQSNMNVNEVIANIANESLGSELGSKSPIHPNDHVNKGQSSNDCFPTAMHVSTVMMAKTNLIPSLKKMQDLLHAKSAEWRDIIKIGRTHMQDATPITLGQEFSAYACQIEHNIKRIEMAILELYALAQGGTAVGTGINTHPEFAEKFAAELSVTTNLPFVSAKNKFEALSTCDALVNFSSTLNSLAVSVNKMANDIRLLSSGPRCGLGEISLPENEPGSSIMPGKVNPTQCEALTMIAAQVMGNHVTVSIAGSDGQLQLNVYRPVIIHNILQSIELMADGCFSFSKNCLEGIKVNKEKIDDLAHNSLMLVTALNPHIGYDNSAKIAKEAYHSNITLKAAAIKLGILTSEQFDKLIDLKKMINEK
ncbi:MAG: class II fumarate hydratase [Rickettsiaceae bacterium]|nr:class II fumarate hydratase [Rickettsiaceae bacterium]